MTRSLLPASMPEDEKDAYRYGWRRGRRVCLDDAETRYQDAARPVFNAFHDGYEDRAIGRDFGATPRGEADD